MMNYCSLSTRRIQMRSFFTAANQYNRDSSTWVRESGGGGRARGEGSIKIGRWRRGIFGGVVIFA